LNTVEGPPRSQEPLVNGRGDVVGLPPDGTDLRSITSAEVLRQRPSRPPDYAAENLALVGLVQSLSTAPEDILQRLADTALNVCRAHSAGLSLLEDGDQRTNFHWRAIAGEFSHHLNGGTPRDFGPCGTVLDRNAAQLCSHPEIDFPYFSDAKPPLDEILLVPFYIAGTAVGTIWIVSHDVARRRFDALLAKAAEAMHLRLVEIAEPEVAEIAALLPAGRLADHVRSLSFA
jgi:GAF domain